MGQVPGDDHDHCHINLSKNMSRAGLAVTGFHKAAGSRVQEGPSGNCSGWWLKKQSNCRAECELGGHGGHACGGSVGEDTAEGSSGLGPHMHSLSELEINKWECGARDLEQRTQTERRPGKNSLGLLMKQTSSGN